MQVAVEHAMRVWLIVALAALLGACQPTASVAPVQEPAGPASADSGPRYFDPEVEALMSEIGEKLGRACVDRPTRIAFDNCIRDQFAVAFDDSGLGRKSCDFHTALADFLGCVVVGNSLIDLRHRLSDDSPVPAGFWSGDSAMSDALIATIIRQGAAACDKPEASGSIEDCLNDWFERGIALPPDLASRCDAVALERDREQCLGEAFMLRFLQDHTPRLGGIST